MHLTDEEIDAMVAESLRRPQGPVRIESWRCVDDDGRPRTVEPFSPVTP